jgi:hypothetical protein
MRHALVAAAAAVALLVSPGMAAAQRTTGPTNVILTAPEAQTLAKGLASRPDDTAPSGYDAQVGGTLPDGLAHRPVPPEVTAQVPDVDRLHYSKLPDRILLVDPNNKMVVEIVPTTGGPATTGSGTAR